MGGFYPSFAASSGIWQGCPISSFFNSAVDSLLRRVFDSFVNFSVGLLLGPTVDEFDCADDVALLKVDPQVAQAALNHLATEVTMCGIRPARSKYKLFCPRLAGRFCCTCWF